MAKIRISNHAYEQMEERGISEETVNDILNNPGQTKEEEPDKRIYQSIKFFEEEGKDYLVRVFVNVTKDPNLVITVYRTSKIEKYWMYED